MSTQKQRENTMKLLNTVILTAVKYRNASSKQIMQESFLVRILAAVINDEEFFMLYDHSASKNPYWNYQQFDLENLSDEEYKAEFCFYKTALTFSKKYYIYQVRSFFQKDYWFLELKQYPYYFSDFHILFVWVT